MKKIRLFILLGILTFTVGYYIGYSKGGNDMYKSSSNLSAEHHRYELTKRENENIEKYLKGNAWIKKINEGTFFKKRYVKYITGTIKNDALIANAKDIKIKLTFLSKTKSEIGNTEIIIYEIIKPGESKKFKKRINITEDVSGFKWDIISAK